ncbi:unnamed protein product [Camellia sinensis]
MPLIGRRYFYWHCDCNCCSCKYQTDLEDHAGAVLMPNRNDAELASAKLALVVEKHVLESASVVKGILEPHPGAIDSIPSKSHLEIVLKTTEAQHCNIANLYMQVMITRAYHDSSTLRTCGEQIEDLVPVMEYDISFHVTEKLIRPGTLNSCHLTVKGLSEPPYTPEEFASIEDMEDGVEVLALTLVQQSLY